MPEPDNWKTSHRQRGLSYALLLTFPSLLLRLNLEHLFDVEPTA